MRLILLGAPGSGKGTMAAVLASRLGVAHISTGDLFRKHLDEGSELGNLAKSYMDQGQLVPDDVTIRMVKDRLNEDDTKDGFIFDGFPRTISQAEALEKLLEEAGSPVDAAVDLVVPDEELFRRITTRRVCLDCGMPYNVLTRPTKIEGVCDSCGGNVVQRADDNEETLKKRLDVYRTQTAPLIDFYAKRGLLVEYDNDRKSDSASIEDVLHDIRAAVAKKDEA
jgi:adenylate kinase